MPSLRALHRAQPKPQGHKLRQLRLDQRQRPLRAITCGSGLVSAARLANRLAPQEKRATMKRLSFALLALCAAAPALAQTVTSPDARAGTIAAVEAGRTSCRSCDLFQADFSFDGLSGRDFTGARLRQADLSLATADGARFTGADLSLLNGFGGRFARADLGGANLTGATLVGADLGQARWTGAILTSVNLSGADLSGARGLTQRQLDAACGDEQTVLPQGLRIGRC